MANLKSTTIDDTGFLQLPSGTTSERPSSPSPGEIRFNTDTKVTEWYDAELDAWFPTSTIPPVATGGDSVQDFNINGEMYRIHVYSSTGASEFTVSRAGNIEILVVAGGGSGGGGFNDSHTGGGGAGGVVFASLLVDSETYPVFVGSGGSGSFGTNGENSFFGAITALGGGGGGDRTGSTTGSDGDDGGSGGGGAGLSNNFGGFPLQTTRNASFGVILDAGNIGGRGDRTRPDNPYGNGGGGGGAGAPGLSPLTTDLTSGGAGVSLLAYFGDSFGENSFFGGGGAGLANYSPSFQGPGGIGGGGTYEQDGEENTGGGGGAKLGNGGSGIVIIRYRIS